MKKYHLITYGCQMNTADSEEMAQPLEARGFRRTGQLKDADIVLMNTCTVREQAEHRAKSNLGRLKDWKKANPNRILIVAGCAASRWGDSIRKRYPYIDLVAPALQMEKFPELVERVLTERWDYNLESDATFRIGEGAHRRIGETAEQESSSGLFADAPPRRRADAAVAVSPIRDVELFGDSQTAYVTTMRGCNYSCSYCIVPQVRGREVYRPLPEILAEIEQKAARGLTEVMLLGQTVNSYYYRVGEGAHRRIGESAEQESSSGLFADAPPRRRADASVAVSPMRPLADPPIRRSADPAITFADLLRAVNAVAGVTSIRFMSPHPRHMRESVIAAMQQCEKVARHIHLPVQSGADRILAAMERHYRRDDYLRIVEKLRRAMPGILVTTDVIVGFPGETAADFQATLELMRVAQFDGLFAFKYSPRPGTASAALADDVSNDEKEKRLQQVLALNQEIKRAARPTHESGLPARTVKG